MGRLLFLFLLCVGLLGGEEKPNILVSIPAYVKIVQQLVGESATVQSVIPPLVSFHTYEPHPKDIEEAYSSILWFYIGDPFEKKIIDALISHKSPIVRMDLREGLSLINESGCHSGEDPHIWLDPRMMKQQLVTIAKSLKKKFPGQSGEIDVRLASLIEKIDILIEKVDGLLKPMKGKVIVVAHGAYGYLCREYGFNQLSLEKEGKEPSIASFTNLIRQAQASHVKTVFSIKQFPKIGIERVADILGAKMVELDPYTEDYVENMLSTAEKFHEAMNEESLD